MLPRFFLSLFLSIFFLFAHSPVLSRDSGLIGIGHADGPAQLNGIAFLDGSNLYSGDRIQTGPETNFLVLTSPKERSVIEPNSVAQLRRDAGATIIALEEGSVAVYTWGCTRVVLESLGIGVRAVGDSPSLGRVEALTERQVRVSAIRGSVEVSAGARPTVLDPGQSAMILDTMDQELGDIYGLASTHSRHLDVRVQHGPVTPEGIVSVVKRHRKHRSPHTPNNDDDD